jgi:hypothetical protein
MKVGGQHGVENALAAKLVSPHPLVIQTHGLHGGEHMHCVPSMPPGGGERARRSSPRTGREPPLPSTGRGLG